MANDGMQVAIQMLKCYSEIQISSRKIEKHLDRLVAYEKLNHKLKGQNIFEKLWSGRLDTRLNKVKEIVMDSNEWNLEPRKERSLAMKVKIKRLPHYPSDWELPQYGTQGAACFDLRVADHVIQHMNPQSFKSFSTGLSFEVPEGYVLQVKPRSGLAFKQGLVGFEGTVDSDYRGEVKILVFNHSNEYCVIQYGDAIAQAMIIPVPRIEWEESEELSETGRGTNGFGSTGR